MQFQPFVMEKDLHQRVIPHPACVELVDFLRKARQTQSDSGEASSAFEKKARFFLEMFNGNTSTNQPVHICSHECLLADERHCRDRQQAVQRCTDALIDLFMSSMPSIPTPNKWTTMFGPLDFVVSGSIVNGWLQQAFENAFKGMTFAEFDSTGETCDPKLVEALSFHAVNGKRCSSSLAFLQDPDAVWAVKLLCLTLEANKVLTWYWLSCLGKSLKEGERPPLYCLLDKRCSVVIQVLQHYASLLLNPEGNGRLTLLWGNTPHESFGDFCLREPGRVRQLRRILLLASGWVYRRHWLYLNSDPFVMTLTGDSAADPDVVQLHLDFWDIKHHCCVPPGICRDLKKKGIKASDLKQPMWRSVMFWTAGSMQLSMADVESLHSQNRVFAGSAFSSISSKFVNHEAARFQQEAAEAQRPSSSGSKSKSNSGTSIKSSCGNITIKDFSNKTTNAKAMSAFEIFRSRFLQSEKSANDGVVNPCSKDVWHRVKDTWASLSVEERQVYEALANESKISAAFARSSQQARVVANHGDVSTEEGDQSEALAVKGNSRLQRLHAQCLPLNRVCDAMSLPNPQSAMEEMKKMTSKQVANTETDSANFAKTYPLSEACLEKSFEHQRANGSTGKDSMRRFQQDSERIGRPPSQDDIFPKKVIHESHCGEQCRHFGDPQRIQLHVNLLLTMQALVAWKGGVKPALLSDLLCV